MEEFEIVLDGDFGWEITLANFRRELIRAAGVNLRISLNSPGGSVVEATAIKNSLEKYLADNKASVTFEVVGWVQSAATYLMMVPGAAIIVHPNSLFMYHNPQSCACGDYKELERRGTFLRDLAGTYAEAYAAISGKSIEVVQADMDAETYFIGQDIVDNGFATEMVDTLVDAVGMNGSEQIIARGRNEYGRCIGRLAAAAAGHDVSNFAPAQMASEGVDTEGDSAMSDKNTPAPDNGATMAAEARANETKRAEAWMKASELNPTMKDALYKAFADGEPVEFFRGFVASAEMRAAAENNATAQGENVPPVDTGEQELEKQVLTAGMTGEMVEA